MSHFNSTFLWLLRCSLFFFMLQADSVVEAQSIVVFPPQNRSYNCIEIEDILLSKFREALSRKLQSMPNSRLLPQMQRHELNAELEILQYNQSDEERIRYMMDKLGAEYAIGFTVLDYEYNYEEGDGLPKNACTYEQWTVRVSAPMYPTRPDMVYTRPMPQRTTLENRYNYSQTSFTVYEDHALASMLVAIYLYDVRELTAIYEDTGSFSSTWDLRRAQSDVNVNRLCDCPRGPTWKDTPEPPARLDEPRESFFTSRTAVPSAEDLLRQKVELFAAAQAMKIFERIARMQKDN